VSKSFIFQVEKYAKKKSHHPKQNRKIVSIESRTASPIVPKPKTATVDDLWTLAIFQADPTPFFQQTCSNGDAHLQLSIKCRLVQMFIGTT
jgi:hypothetical protein